VFGVVRDLILKDFKRHDIVAVGSGIELALKVSTTSKTTKVQVFKPTVHMLRFEDRNIEFVEQRKMYHFAVGVLSKTEHLKTISKS
jgi:hypothetical protein